MRLLLLAEFGGMWDVKRGLPDLGGLRSRGWGVVGCLSWATSPRFCCLGHRVSGGAWDVV